MEDNIKEYIDQLTDFDIERASLLKQAKLIMYILKNHAPVVEQVAQNTVPIDMITRLDAVESAVNNIQSDILTAIQSVEIAKKLDTSQVDDFNKNIKSLAEENKSSRALIDETSEAYFIRCGMQKLLTFNINKVEYDIGALGPKIYTLGKLTGPEYILSPEADDAEKIKYFTNLYRYMESEHLNNKNAAYLRKNFLPNYENMRNNAG